MRRSETGRAARAWPLLAASLAAAPGCVETEPAIEVTFEVTGPRAGEATHIEVRLRCADGSGEAVGQTFDLRGLGAGVAPTLAISPPSSAPCDFDLEVQLLGAPSGALSWPLASAREALAYAGGRVRRVTVALDTGRCDRDVDGDGAVAGGGCEPPADCDDLDAARHVGAEESCDGADNDCDGAVDDLAPAGDEGCPADGTALVVTFHVVGEGSEAAEVVEAAFLCAGVEGRSRRERVALGGAEASLAIHPPSGEVCVLELSAQALGPADGAGVRWPLASSSEELSFVPGEVARATVTLDTAACSDRDSDLFPVGAGCLEALVDCDDLEPGVFSGSVEQCNDRDDDCDGQVDERPDLGPWCEMGETFALAAFRLIGDAARQAERIEVAHGLGAEGAALERVDIELHDPEPGDRVVLSLPGDGEDGAERVVLAQLRGPAPPAGEVDWPLASAGRRFAFVEGQVQRLELRLDADACADADGDGSVAGPGGEAGCAGARDCDDLVAAVHLGAAERCDGRDTDCDGAVDDLSTEALAAACPGWNPSFGLCRLPGVAPRCAGDAPDCPGWLLAGRDDCDLYLDTTCDGRVSGCGCNTGGVSCPACYEAACDGEDTVCEPAGAEDFTVVSRLEVGQPCRPAGLPACPGTIACDAEAGLLVCERPREAAEICNDGARVDEDCDGLVDLDEADCRLLAGIDRSCSALALPRPSMSVGSPPTPCTAELDAASCAALTDERGLTDAAFAVNVALPAGVSLGVTGSTCCWCDVSVVTTPGGAAIAIDPTGDRLYVVVDRQLEIEASLHLSRAGSTVAVLRDQALRVAIDDPPPDPGTGRIRPVCVASCGSAIF